MGAFGLQTHIWNNNMKSVILLIGFPVMLLLLMYGLSVVYVGLTQPVEDLGQGLRLALGHLARLWPFAFLSAGIWFAIAWFSHQAIIEASVGAKGLSRRDAPHLYNLLENLCIERGITMPRLNIIETSALNAFASGVTDKSYKITVTRGLLQALEHDELEAVLAHELTHIVNKDVRLLIVAVIFVGIFSFFGEIVFRSMFYSGIRVGGHTRSRHGDSRGGGMMIIIGLVMVAIAYFLAMVIRFALSQKREYLADAGAVELTRNPDAMINALARISGHSEIDAPDDVRQMMIDNGQAFAGIFATHPPIKKRIAALRAFAG